MLMQGLNLTIIGMSIVFVFLAMLVLLLHIISTLVRSTEETPEEGAEAVDEQAQKLAEEQKIAAAISAALKYKKTLEQG
jgi:sodium pump decarboxylase gamma subunit